jgi:tetratricopeptide (TPR) repeat protein
MLLSDNILKLIPASFKDSLLEILVEFIYELALKYASHELADRIKKLRMDASFVNAFEDGLKRAARRFKEEYEIQDEDLVAAINSDKTIFENKQVQSALMSILKRPDSYQPGERDVLLKAFDKVLPLRKNRERVEKAVLYLLECVVKELWHLPQLGPIYSLQFQRVMTDAALQQVQLNRDQLRALKDLNSSIRNDLVAVIDALIEEKISPEVGVTSSRANVPVLHNLPHGEYSEFFGREEEISVINRILRPYPHSQLPIVTIDGIGGVGKTALALEVGHQWLRNYKRVPQDERFDAIIFMSAKRRILTAEKITERYQELRNLDDLYLTIAVVLEREEITRSDRSIVDARIRNVLTKQRTLLILDNLETVDDYAIMSFLRELPAPTKAIVTTRHRFDGSYFVRLTGMEWADAQALINKECERTKIFLRHDEILLLFERTGGVPLAIVWSIAQIGRGYGVDTVLARLANPTDDIAQFCFEGSMERIRNRPPHKLMIALSLCSVDSGREALGIATQLPDIIRDDGLVELESLSLVNRHNGRFGFLPLTREFALSELQSARGSKALRRRWVAYFFKLCQIYSGEHWNWKNYDWLIAEGENILSIVDSAIAYGSLDIALGFVRATMYYLEIQGSYNRLVDYGERLLGIAELKNDKRASAWICEYWLAWPYAEQGKFERAERVARIGLALYEELKDKKGICFGMRQLGRVLRLRGNLQEDKDLCNRAMELALKSSYGDAVADIHFELGRLARDCETWEDARFHFRFAVDWYEQNQDQTDLGINFFMGAIGNLGWIEFKIGNSEEGKKLIERSLNFFEHIGARGNTTTLQCRLAFIEYQLGNRQAALKCAEKAHLWAEKLGMIRELDASRRLLSELDNRT